MLISARDLAIASVTFGLATLILSQAPARVERQLPAIRPQGPGPSLSKNQKLQAALTQLKGKVNLKGVRSLITLTANQPMVKDVARMDFTNLLQYSTSFEPGSTGSAYGYGEDDRTAPYNLGMEGRVTYYVARPNTVHVFTFYVSGSDGQKMAIDGVDFPLKSGVQAIPVAKISGSGVGAISFHPAKKSTLTLFKVEIDVLD